MKALASFLLLVLLGAGLAWWLGRNPAAPPAAPAQANHAASTHPAPSPPASSGSKAAAAQPAAHPTAADAAIDIAGEGRRVLQLTSPAQRQLAFAQLLAAAQDEAALRAVLDVFESLRRDGIRNGAEWATFWAEVIERDPKLAVSLSKIEGRDAAWRAGVASLIAHEWAVRDPQAAIAWLDQDTRFQGKDLDNATLSLLSGFAGRDPRGATTYALGIIAQDDPLFGDTAYILSSAAMQRGGPDALFAWFEALPDDTLKHRLFPSVSNRLERLSLDQRAAWLASQAASPYRNDLAYRDFAGQWAETDPAAALAWVLSLPPSPRDGSVAGLGYAVFPWLERDLTGFTAHFQHLPEAQQQAIVSTVRQITSDPKFPSKKRLPGLAFLQSLK